MIAIIDYGLGNVNAFLNFYNRSNIKCFIARTSNDIRKADKIILPGVGSFDGALSKFNDSGMRNEIENQISKKRIPILGVCVGMQIMFQRSEEGNLEGLGWFKGAVKKIKSKEQNIKLPHMGWNKINKKADDPILRGLDETYFYFLHSFVADFDESYSVLAESTYHQTFPSIVKKDNLFGIQCHPEKSHDVGAKFLINFSEIKC